MIKKIVLNFFKNCLCTNKQTGSLIAIPFVKTYGRLTVAKLTTTIFVVILKLNVLLTFVTNSFRNICKTI